MTEQRILFKCGCLCVPVLPGKLEGDWGRMALSLSSVSFRLCFQYLKISVLFLIHSSLYSTPSLFIFQVPTFYTNVIFNRRTTNATIIVTGNQIVRFSFELTPFFNFVVGVLVVLFFQILSTIPSFIFHWICFSLLFCRCVKHSSPLPSLKSCWTSFLSLTLLL